MSSHPGSTLNEAIDLALCLKRDHYAPEQVQDYYPTPGTASTVMFYTGINPLDMKPVYVVTDYHEKQLQRALLQFNRPENADLVREALTKAGRTDLIGFGPECLVRPANGGRPAPRGEGKPAPKGGKPAAQKNGAPAKGGKFPPKGDTPKGGRPAPKSGNASAKAGAKPAPKGGRPTSKAPAGGNPKGGKPKGRR